MALRILGLCLVALPALPGCFIDIAEVRPAGAGGSGVTGAAATSGAGGSTSVASSGSAVSSSSSSSSGSTCLDGSGASCGPACPAGTQCMDGCCHVTAPAPALCSQEIEINEELRIYWDGCDTGVEPYCDNAASTLLLHLGAPAGVTNFQLRFESDGYDRMQLQRLLRIRNAGCEATGVGCVQPNYNNGLIVIDIVPGTDAQVTVPTDCMPLIIHVVAE